MAQCPAPEPAQLLPKPQSWKEMRVKLGMAAEKRWEVVSPCSQMCRVPGDRAGEEDVCRRRMLMQWRQWFWGQFNETSWACGLMLWACSGSARRNLVSRRPCRKGDLFTAFPEASVGNALGGG